MLTLPKTVQLLHRPHVITPDAASHYLPRLHGLDERLHERRGNTLAILQRFAAGLARRPSAMDDDGEGRREPTRPAVYAPMWLGEPEAEGEFGWTLKDGVALLSVDTPLVEHGFGFCGTWFHGYDSIEASIREADADARVKAHFIHWDTPGGVVAPGLNDLTAFMQARGPDAKPIWSYCDMACSGGYWLAAQTDRIVAPHVGIVGSIGAVYTHVSNAGALEKAGYVVTAIQFGEFKTDGAEWKLLSDSARANLQAMVDDLGEDFLAAVEAGRGPKLTAEKARATGAQVYPAEHRDPAYSGLALGFVDAIMPQQDAFIALRDQVAATVIPIRPAASASGRKPAARAAQPKKETTVKLSASLKALAKSETDPTKRATLLASARIAAEGEDDKKKDDETTAEGEGAVDEECECAGEEGCECDKPEADAEGEDDKPAEDDKKKDEPAAKAASAQLARAKAIMALPEAKGRDALAQDLAFDASITVARAKTILSKAAKTSTLGGRMTDVDVSASGGKKATEDDRFLDAAFAIAGVTPAKR